MSDAGIIREVAGPNRIREPNDVVDEFHATREPYRWMHLVCGAQAAAVSFGKNMEVFEVALELMHAA